MVTRANYRLITFEKLVCVLIIINSAFPQRKKMGFADDGRERKELIEIFS
jgi:hypothetical protein